LETKISVPVKLHIFFCSNSIDKNEIDRLSPEEEGDEYKIISLPCSGKADLLYFIKSFETGADGLVLIICPKNECRHLEGNLRAPRRAHQVGALLEEIGLGQGRVAVFNSNGRESGRIVSMVEEFRDSIRRMIAEGPGAQDGSSA
jgi:coenzyme F420-reducing hydrogenase delta subunit